MRLLINAIPLLGEESGIGTYTRHIASAVLSRPDEFQTTFFYGYTSDKLISSTPDQSVSILGHLKNLAKKNDFVRRAAKKALSLSNRVAKTLFPRKWDCYFEPNFIFLPTLEADCSIMTLHDFSCFRYPQWHPDDRVEQMQKFLPKSLERAKLIITASETIRQEAIRDFGIPPNRLAAIHHGVDREVFHPADPAAISALSAKYNLPHHFILHVGALEPRKNLSNLITAHSLLPPRLREEFPLLLVGPKGWKNETILRQIDEAAPHVRLVGRVPIAELPAFYSAASLFVYPSWYEGFGLPVLEALACGRPVLASTDAALTELCGGAARQAAPHDPEGMATALEELLEDQALREELGKRALSRAAGFSWEKSGAEHMRLFKNPAC